MCPWLFTIYSVGGNRPSESSAFMTTDGHLKPSLYTEMTWNIDELLPSRPEHINDPAHRIAMLDHMARGRIYWGIGFWSLPTDLQLHGIGYDTTDEDRELLRPPWDEMLRTFLGPEKPRPKNHRNRQYGHAATTMQGYVYS